MRCRPFAISISATDSTPNNEEAKVRSTTHAFRLGYIRESPIFIQILLRHIIFRHFVSLYLALIGIQSIFYALYRLTFQSVPFL